MITSIFIYIIGAFISILGSLLSAITSFIPDNIQNSFTYLSGFLVYFNGVINFEGVFGAFVWYTIFLSLWFSFLTVMWIWHKMPFVGKADKK